MLCSSDFFRGYHRLSFKDGRLLKRTLTHPVTMVTAERKLGAIVLVWSSEIVRRPIEESGHAEHDDFPHVGRLVLVVGVSAVAVDGVSHLHVHDGAVGL